LLGRGSVLSILGAWPQANNSLDLPVLRSRISAFLLVFFCLAPALSNSGFSPIPPIEVAFLFFQFEGDFFLILWAARQLTLVSRDRFSTLFLLVAQKFALFVCFMFRANFNFLTKSTPFVVLHSAPPQYVPPSAFQSNYFEVDPIVCGHPAFRD